MDFREIPKGGKKYKWAEAIGSIVYCQKENQEYKLLIKDCFRKNNKPRVILTCLNEGWKELDFEIDTTHLQNCYINTLLNNIYANPEYNWMIKYVGEDTAKKLRYCGSLKVKCTCPNCGYKKEMKPATIYRQGFGCIICGDGVSYPEKVFGNILKQLGIAFKNQHSFNKKEKYDFYFQLGGEDYIVETHGRQHYEGGFERAGGFTLEDEQRNDENKYKMALDSGIKAENYIVIDCRNSQIKWILDSIKQTKLNEVLDLTKIDYDLLSNHAESSLMKKAIDIHNSRKATVTEIGEELGVSPSTISHYLKRGADLGWCVNATQKWENAKKEVCVYFKKYGGSPEQISKVFDLNPNTVAKYLKEGNKLGLCNYKIKKTVKGINIQTGEEVVFEGLDEASKWLKEQGATTIVYPHSSISACALGKKKTAYGYTWHYIGQDEQIS